MENILVLTNFSESAQSAAESAIALATDLGTDVIMLNTYADTPEASLTEWSIPDHLTQSESQQQLEKKISALQKSLTGDTSKRPELRYLQQEGSIIPNLQQLIKEMNVKLVVMGGGQQKFYFGNHVSSVINEIRCPLLVVPEGINKIDLHNITFASDLDLNDVKRISKLHQILQPLAFQLHICHVAISLLVPDFKEDDETTTFRDTLNAEQLPRTYFYAMDDDQVIDALDKFNASVNADLLVITHKKHNFFWRLFSDDLSKMLLKRQKTPLLMLPENFHD